MITIKDRIHHASVWWKWLLEFLKIRRKARKDGINRLELVYLLALHRQREPKLGKVPITRDWEEDFHHENGNYLNNCCQCRGAFTGHKRRHICHRCVWESRLALASLRTEDREDLLSLRMRELQEFFNKPITNEEKRTVESATGCRSSDLG